MIISDIWQINSDKRLLKYVQQFKKRLTCETMDVEAEKEGESESEH